MYAVINRGSHLDQRHWRLAAASIQRLENAVSVQQFNFIPPLK
jgi:hypothetical protein